MARATRWWLAPAFALGLLPGSVGAARPDDRLEVRGKVVDDETGEPVPRFIVQGGRADPQDPKQFVWGFTEGRTESANPEGAFSEVLGPEKGWWKRVIAPGYQPQPITNRPYDGENGTIDVVIRLKRGREVAGRVLDHRGRPIAGASVFLVGGRGQVNLTGGKALRPYGPGDEDETVHKVATDDQGRFALTGGGRDIDKVAVSAAAPGVDLWVVPAPEPARPLEIRLPEPGRIVVRYDIPGDDRVATIFSQLLREPLGGHWNSASNIREERAINGGVATLDNVTPGTYHICRRKSLQLENLGMMPFLENRGVKVGPGKTVEVDFTRPKGAPVEGEVAGLKAHKLSGAMVYLRRKEAPADPDLIDALRTGKMEALTVDAGGKFVTPKLPPGPYVVEVEAYEPEPPGARRFGGRMGPSHRATAEVVVPEDGPAPKVRIELPPPKPPEAAEPGPRAQEAARPEEPKPAVDPNSVAISGRLTDAMTGEPIARGRIIPAPVESGQRRNWQPHLIRDIKDGRFEYRSDRAWTETAFRIEADGYRPFVTRGVPRGKATTINVALQPDPGPPGRVVDADGRPVAGARVALATMSIDVRVREGRAEVGGQAERMGYVVVETDADGRFRLRAEPDRARAVVTSPAGWAEIDPRDLAREPTVRLAPWGRIEGRILAGARPVAGRSVRAYRSTRADADSPDITWDAAATSDADGRFACDKLPAGSLIVDRDFPAGPDTRVHLPGLAAAVELGPGETRRIVLGGEGRPAVGQFEAPDDFGRKVDWTKVLFQIAPRPPHIGLAGDDAIWKAYGRFLESDEGRDYSQSGLTVAADGSFRVDRVPQGTHRLHVWIPGAAVGKPEDKQTTFAAAFAELPVPPTETGRDDTPIELGVIKLRP